MRRSFCGSHRERVEAAAELQTSRRRRRISLELEEFERPGGRALVEDSPEVEAYLAALSVAERPRRASIDCPRGAYGIHTAPHNGGPSNPLKEEEERDDEEEVDSKLGEVKREPEPSIDKMQINSSAERSMQGQSFNEGSRSTPKKMMSSARRACSSFMRRLTNQATGSQSRINGVHASPADPQISFRVAPPPFLGTAMHTGILPHLTPRVKINDTWAGEGKLNEWVDWGVVDSALRPPDLRQAQAALITGSRGTGQLVAASAGSSKS